MRAFRLALWFVVGLLLGGVAVLANAQTVAAAKVWNSTPVQSAFPDACNTQAGPGGRAYFGATSCTVSNGLQSCTCVWGTAADYVPLNSYTQIYSCASGYTLSGTSCVPVAKDCSTLLLTSGACAEPCTAGQENTQFNKSTSAGTESNYCGSNNCSKAVVSRTPVATACAYGSTGFGLCQTGYTVTLKSTGAYCDYEAGGTPNTNQPVADKNDSPCPAGYGVASAANGYLRCLPPGTSTPSKTETTTVDPLGNVKKTEVVDPSVSKTTCTGDTCTKTTSTVDGAGVVSTVVSTSSKSTFCENNPNNSACSGAGGDGSDLSFSPPSAGKFGGKSAEITEAQNAISDELNLIKAQASAMLGKLSTGAGSMPCPEAITVLGSSFRLCSSAYQNQLSPIASAVLLMGALGAIFVIFR